jgi:sugar lactone lactonase YvrE
MIKIMSAAALCAFCSLASSKPALALEVLATFDPTQGEIPESVTTDDHGNLYFSMSNTVRRRSPGGQMSVFGTLPIAAFALGVKVGQDGCVYTASTSLSGTPGAFVWRICSPGVVEQFAELDQQGGPNDLAFDDDQNLFVTDPVLGKVWKITRQAQVSVFLANPLLQGNPLHPALVFRPLGVDGIAFDKHKRNLYLSNVDFGRIVRVDLRASCMAGDVSVFAEDPRLEGVDGIAFDNEGTLFVTVNAQDRLASIDRHGFITVLSEGGLLDGPSSVVFGATHDDRHTLYLTSSAFSRAFGFQPGTPHPALLKMDVQHRGLPLP